MSDKGLVNFVIKAKASGLSEEEIVAILAKNRQTDAEIEAIFVAAERLEQTKSAGDETGSLTPPEEDLVRQIKDRRFKTRKQKDLLALLFKVGFVLLLFWGSLGLYTGQTKWIFMNNINLIFHEAGHKLFMFFGQFLTVLGGTLTEILIPLIIIVHFLIKRNIYAVGFGLWWLSIAFWSISIYAGDAQARVLPLLGGGDGGHDWAYILDRLGILEHDSLVANIFLLLSIMSVSFAAYYFYRDLDQNYKLIKTTRSNTFN